MAPSKEEKQARTLLALCNDSFNMICTQLASLQDPDPASYSKLQAMRNNFVPDFNRLKDAVLLLDSSSSTFSLFCELKNKYVDVTPKLDECIQKLAPEPVRPSSPVSSAASSALNFKLPEITLPEFRGDVLHWPRFRDIFTNLVINSELIDNATKFCYLNGCLHGEPKQLLQNLSVSNENFQIAWELLKRRYDCPRLIVNRHLAFLLSPPPLVPNSAASLRKLIDFFRLHIEALLATRQQADLSDLLLSALVTQHLPPDLLRRWELSISDDRFRSFEDLMVFLNLQQRGLQHLSEPAECAGLRANDNPLVSSNTSKGKKQGKASSASFSACPLCSSDHPMFSCPDFLNLSPRERGKVIKTHNRCYRCLRYRNNGHFCQAVCETCSRGHHTLLHFGQTDTQGTSSSAVVNSVSAGAANLLPTASVYAFGKSGQHFLVNALLDSGSSANLISEDLSKTLALPLTNCKVNIAMVGQTPIAASHSVQITLSSRAPGSSWLRTLDFIVIPSIPTTLSKSLDTSDWNVPSHLPLADPLFNHAKPIHLLLGAGVYFEILLPGQLKRSEAGYPIMQETTLGWVLAGPTPHHPATGTVCNFARVDKALSEQLQNFWVTEEVVPTSPIVSEVERAEAHFTSTHTRDAHGRYAVSLPLISNPPPLGDSKPQALKRLFSLERKLAKDNSLKRDYREFMHEYIKLGHMRPAPPDSFSQSYYIPHHAVLKPSSTTTKLRVVFDASARSSSGVSLNDLLLNGDRIQCDLMDTLLRFRFHRFALAADLEKMFRQVNVSREDWHFQHVLWRDSPSHPVSDYVLSTVTYGTRPATFLAVRTLHQLADDERHHFPRAAEALKTSFYVDDFLTSCSDVNSAKLLVSELNSLLGRGGFTLRKWSSNSSQVLSDLPGRLLAKVPVRSFGDKSSDTINALGLVWDNNADVLSISLNMSFGSPGRKFSKRSTLAAISSLWDPLGLLAPSIIGCKIIFQRLWKFDLAWDDPLPPEIEQDWLTIYYSLKELPNITIPRCVFPEPQASCEFHGFCDSSLVAYGAAIYVRSTSQGIVPSSRLLCAKSRVTPSHMKVTEDNSPLTIPRLELCAAVLLVKLMNRVKASIAYGSSGASYHYWSDSSVVLSWIRAPPMKGNVFARNRAQYIIEHTADCTWRHVASEHNPADLLTRGVTPVSLRHSIWWTGPTFLSQDSGDWASVHVVHVPPSCPVLVCATQTPSWMEERICNHYSSFLKAIRVMAYVLRFLSFLCTKRQGGCVTLPQPNSGPLTVSEITIAENTCVRLIQCRAFSMELKALRVGDDCPTNSKMLSLSPFLHSDGCLRVGGRLENSGLPFDAAHPLILPHSHPFVRALIMHNHRVLLHAQPHLLISNIRRRFWILSARRAVRNVLRSCLTCFKHAPVPAQQIMGHLPAVRLTPDSSFKSVGVDYTGYYELRVGGPRSRTTQKVYLALFICMVSRAVHIEIVTSLTTEAFLMCLKRFIARRGLPSAIYSDNATTFQGAKGKLALLHKLLHSPAFQEQVQNFCTPSKITWHNIPPRSPHCGGIWEANIKSLKHHLKRVMGSMVYSFEELLTLTVQIEALLNSRPIVRLSDSPDCLDYLTPGHFLVGRPLTSLPEPVLINPPLKTHLSRWQEHQRRLACLWRRWSLDYLHTLQQRSKWTSASPNISLNTPVLLIEDNAPPFTWRLGIITKLFPGRDNRIRTVQVKTNVGSYIRHVNRLCPLPTSSE